MKSSLPLFCCTLCYKVRPKRAPLIPQQYWIRFASHKFIDGLYTTPEQMKANTERSTPGKSVKHELKFLDTLRIFCRGGKGGDGYPKKRGLGGKGGDVMIQGSSKPTMTLQDVKKAYPTKRISAEHGHHAKLFTLFGDNGNPAVIKVPWGVTAYLDTGEILGEVNGPKDAVVVAKGGTGGNEENGFGGQLGEAHVVLLDLKVIADVGFVGFPNAGKSTSLKALSGARPRIASYPFTTIRPNIGVIKYPDERRISLADLPGLIEGAHMNQGMGHRFLKHVERTKVLLFVVDLHGFQLGPKYPFRNAAETIVLLNKELELYGRDVLEKPAILAVNKTDLPGSFELVEKIRDIFYDTDSYSAYLDSLPETFRPERLIKFDEIVPISAAKDSRSISKLKQVIRKTIDVNAEMQHLKMLEEEEALRSRRRISRSK